MIKVNIANAQYRTERLITALENENASMARTELATIKKNAYNKLYHAERRFEETMPSGIEYQVQKAQIKQARIEYQQIQNAVKEVRDYINNPEDYNFKDHRADYFRLQRAFQRMNFIEEKRKAERESVREAQKEAGTVEGVTLLNIRKAQKMNALFENVLYNNSAFNFDKAGLDALAKQIQDLTGYNVLEDLYKHFDTPSHYESGGTGSQIPIYDEVVNISNKLKNMLTAYKESDKLAELEKAVNEFLTMARTG